MNAQSKNAVTAIACTTLPNNVDLQAAAEKKIPMSFENAIESAVELKELTAGSNEKPVSASYVCEADRGYSIRSY